MCHTIRYYLEGRCYWLGGGDVIIGPGCELLGFLEQSFSITKVSFFTLSVSKVIV